MKAVPEGGAHVQGQVSSLVLGRRGGGHRGTETTGLPGSRPVLSDGPLTEPRAVLFLHFTQGNESQRAGLGIQTSQLQPGPFH